MSAVTISEMRALEALAFSHGWTEEQLIDVAGHHLARAFASFFQKPGTIIAYLGKGHNAGDALVAIQILRDQFDWKIAIRPAFPIEDCAPITRKKWQKLGVDAPLSSPPTANDWPRPLVLLDGLLGIGSVGPLRSPISTLVNEMNTLRQNHGARIAAVDLPSGIDADSGNAWPGCVQADVTFMIANAKCGLLNGHAGNFVGALGLVPVEILHSPKISEIEVISPQTMSYGKSPRPFDFHKGMAGRIAIIAGSRQYSGAAVLAATGALCGGAGLVTLYTPANAAAAISAKCPPEVIVHNLTSFDEISQIECDAMVIGCGLGALNASDFARILRGIKDFTHPTVVDANALNAIAKFQKIEILGEQHIITPHPGEFRRLASDLAEMPRELAARQFVNRCPATLLLKGARTLVTQKNMPLWCNSTGTPGMATGGQGDLLAGVIAAKLALGNLPTEAAALAAWLCGRSAEIALSTSEISEESLLPSHVARYLGAAFLDWKSARR